MSKNDIYHKIKLALKKKKNKLMYKCIFSWCFIISDLSSLTIIFLIVQPSQLLRFLQGISCTFVSLDTSLSSIARISKKSCNILRHFFSRAYKLKLFFNVYPASPLTNFWPLISFYNANMFYPLVGSKWADRLGTIKIDTASITQSYHRMA